MLYFIMGRECPEEAMEAMSTLIFAAARFSDLPELCNLRQEFTKRFGSHSESSVNAEVLQPSVYLLQITLASINRS